MSDTVIKVENLGKLYKLGEISTGTLSHDLNRWWAKVRGKEDPFAKIGQINDRTKKAVSEYVWALRDVNFEVKRGEVLGIVGRNGAGKSTLLKILSKVTTPTTGRIKINGRIASLLEVGTGFHHELTGRENIYLNGAILGMSKDEVKSKFDSIVDFAGVERYIDTPVKRYSSGMYVRLAFSVAAFLDPEILIVDEVLAVGDVDFQKKCIGRMKDVSANEGRTVLFVSHNMASLKNLCTRGLLLKNGQIEMQGNVSEVISAYTDSLYQTDILTKVTIDDSFRNYHLPRYIEYTSFEILDGFDSNLYSSQDTIKIQIGLKSQIDVDRFRISFSVNRLDETLAGVFFSREILSISAGTEKKIVLEFKNHQLAKGQYYFDFSVGKGNEVTGITEYDNVAKVLFFEVAFKDKAHNEMIAMWLPQWGSVSFQDVEIIQDI
jgi:lipopolysaccharide transport system ATP-binding protein